MTRKRRISCYIAMVAALCFAFLYFAKILPLEKQSLPRASEHPVAERRYDHYTITDESGEKRLMRVSVVVQVGDEILTEDNRLYEVFKIEQDHAYARFVKKVKL